jgi:hypothetical protein
MYLAKKLKKEGLVPYAEQDSFTIENLSEVESYVGFKSFHTYTDWKNLFSIFEI